MQFVHHHLEHSAIKTPKAIALRHNGRSMTYEQLNERSEQLAQRLKERGINQSEPVGVYLGKSIEAVIAIFAALKAGACYVPIDYNGPLARMEYIVQDCGIRNIITDSIQRSRIEKIVKRNSIRLYDCEMINATDLIAHSGHVPVSESSLAALLYTSGSTGKPKGAMITHGNLRSFLEWAVSCFELDANDRLLSHAPLQFDISFFDIFATVAVGASVVLADAAIASNGKQLHKLAKDEDITIWQSVPSALTLLKLSNENNPSAVLSSVRAVLFSGEIIPEETLGFVLTNFPNASIYNIYGCTETNNTFIYQVPPETGADNLPLPIGAPLPYVQYRIIDDAGHDVPTGQKGHLVVSAPTVMRGYTSAALTHSVLKEQHDRAGNIQRYYMTQDIVIKKSGGIVHFIGRRDAIIKSNGYRVNLLEIEKQIQTFPNVEETAVFAVPSEVIGNQIIARVRPYPDRKVNSLRLKVQCAEALPKYAIPHAFQISTDPLPKNSNGKVDKRLISTEWLNNLTTNTQKEVLL